MKKLGCKWGAGKKHKADSFFKLFTPRQWLSRCMVIVLLSCYVITYEFQRINRLFWYNALSDNTPGTMIIYHRTKCIATPDYFAPYLVNIVTKEICFI